MLCLLKKVFDSIKIAVAAIKRCSEKSRIKAMVQENVPSEYQPEAMARLMKTIDVPREERVRSTREIFDDIQTRLTRDMNQSLEIAWKRERFEQGIALVGRLPEEFRHEVIDTLTDVIELPKAERKERLSGMFQEIQSAIEQRFDAELALLRQRHSELKRKMMGRLLVPECPRLEFTVDFEGLYQKTRATFALTRLQREYATILRPNPLLLLSAILGIAFSVVSTFTTFSAQLGDWVGGNETASIVGTALLSLCFCLFEMTALFMFLSFLPEKLAVGTARLLGIAGSILLVVSTVVIILQRADFGAEMTETPAESIGRVE
jgi:hypothetical protein